MTSLGGFLFESREVDVFGKRQKDKDRDRERHTEGERVCVYVYKWCTYVCTNVSVCRYVCMHMCMCTCSECLRHVNPLLKSFDVLHLVNVLILRPGSLTGK